MDISDLHHALGLANFPSELCPQPCNELAVPQHRLDALQRESRLDPALRRAIDVRLDRCSLSPDGDFGRAIQRRVAEKIRRIRHNFRASTAQ